MGAQATARGRVSLLPGRRVRGRKVSLPRLTQATSPSPRCLCFRAGSLLSSLSLQAMLLGRGFDSWADLLWGGGFPGVLECLGERTQHYRVTPCRQLLWGSGLGSCSARRGSRAWQTALWSASVGPGPCPRTVCRVTWAGRGKGVALSLLCASVRPPAPRRGSESAACEDSAPPGSEQSLLFSGRLVGFSVQGRNTAGWRPGPGPPQLRCVTSGSHCPSLGLHFPPP